MGGVRVCLRGYLWEGDRIVLMETRTGPLLVSPAQSDAKTPSPTAPGKTVARPGSSLLASILSREQATAIRISQGKDTGFVANS